MQKRFNFDDLSFVLTSHELGTNICLKEYDGYLNGMVNDPWCQIFLTDSYLQMEELASAFAHLSDSDYRFETELHAEQVAIFIANSNEGEALLNAKSLTMLHKSEKALKEVCKVTKQVERIVCVFKSQIFPWIIPQNGMVHEHTNQRNFINMMCELGDARMEFFDDSFEAFLPRDTSILILDDLDPESMGYSIKILVFD